MHNYHIVIVSAVFPPEPVTTAYLNYDLAVELSKKYTVTVIRPKPSRPKGRVYDESETVSDFPFDCITVSSYLYPQSRSFGRMREALSFASACNKYIKDHRDRIAFVYNASWQLFGYYKVARMCHRYGIPYLVPIQDIYPESLFTNKKVPSLVKRIGMGILSPIDKYYLKNASIIRTITDEMRDYLCSTRGLPKNKFLVVNNWQDDDKYHETIPDSSSIIRFCYVGSINAHSNTDLIISAFIRANIPNSHLSIYGGGDRMAHCIKIVEDASVNNISFTYVSREEVPNIQSKSDVLVLALPRDNGHFCLPSKLTSYLLSGRPVLASVDEDSTTARILQDNGCGISVKPDNVELLSEGYRLFASLTREQRIDMGKKSRKYAVNEMTRAVNLTKVVNSIVKTINQ